MMKRKNHVYIHMARFRLLVLPSTIHKHKNNKHIFQMIRKGFQYIWSIEKRETQIRIWFECEQISGDLQGESLWQEIQKKSEERIGCYYRHLRHQILKYLQEIVVEYYIQELNLHEELHVNVEVYTVCLFNV